MQGNYNDDDDNDNDNDDDDNNNNDYYYEENYQNKYQDSPMDAPYLINIFNDCTSGSCLAAIDKPLFRDPINEIPNLKGNMLWSAIAAALFFGLAAGTKYYQQQCDSNKTTNIMQQAAVSLVPNEGEVVV
jgi:hypothetical protein